VYRDRERVVLIIGLAHEYGHKPAAMWLLRRDLGGVVDQLVAERGGVRGACRDLAEGVLPVRLADDAEKSACMDDARVQAANVRAVLGGPAEHPLQQSHRPGRYSCRIVSATLPPSPCAALQAALGSVLRRTSSRVSELGAVDQDSRRSVTRGRKICCFIGGVTRPLAKPGERTLAQVKAACSGR
jgi:hypothetical protein